MSFFFSSICECFVGNRTNAIRKLVEILIKFFSSESAYGDC